MSDIFISYAREDKERAAVLAKALENKGWTVWWDRKIPPGKTFSRVIEEAIEAAKCVIVLWSKDSTTSDWVQNEASEGARNKNLVPALIDAVKIPFEFRRIQAADLTDWNAQPGHPGFTNLINAISQYVEPPPAIEKTKKAPQKPDTTTDIQPDVREKIEPSLRRPKRSKKKMIIACAMLAFVIAATSVWFYFNNSAKVKQRNNISRQFESIIEKMEFQLKKGMEARSLVELERINHVIYGNYEPYWNKLQVKAKDQNITVSRWMRRIAVIENRWQEIFQAKKRELSGSLLTR